MFNFAALIPAAVSLIAGGNKGPSESALSKLLRARRAKMAYKWRPQYFASIASALGSMPGGFNQRKYAMGGKGITGAYQGAENFAGKQLGYSPDFSLDSSVAENNYFNGIWDEGQQNPMNRVGFLQKHLNEAGARNAAEAANQRNIASWQRRQQQMQALGQVLSGVNWGGLFS